MNKTVKDFMTTNPQCCDATTSVADVARMMRDHGVGDIIVTKGGAMCGIVTDRDIVVRCVADGNSDRATAQDVCSQDVTRLGPDDDVGNAINVMRKKAIRRLPIIDNGKVVGVISIGDLAATLDPDSALGGISRAAPNH